MVYAKMFLMSLLVFLGLTGIVVAQEPMADAVCDSMLCMILQNFPEFAAWGAAIFTFLAVVLRATAELMLFVSAKLKNAAVGSWAQKVGEFAEWAAKILSWFGAGVPKSILEKKAQALNDKK